MSCLACSWRRASRIACALAVVLAGVACGGGGGDDSERASSDERATTSSTRQARDDAERPTTLGTVSTSTTLSRADRRLTAGDVPEVETLDTAFGEASINGTSYANALIIDRDQYYSGNYTGVDNGRVEIDAGRDERRFLGDLGIPDDQKSATTWRVEISLDGSAPVFSTEVRFGETKKIDLDVTGVLRIRINVSMIGCCGTLAIGNPRFAP